MSFILSSPALPLPNFDVTASNNPLIQSLTFATIPNASSVPLAAAFDTTVSAALAPSSIVLTTAFDTDFSAALAIPFPVPATTSFDAVLVTFLATSSVAPNSLLRSSPYEIRSAPVITVLFMPVFSAIVNVEPFVALAACFATFSATSF